jgi:hypothetical protein
VASLATGSARNDPGGNRGRGETVDAADLKSAPRSRVRVRVPPSAPMLSAICSTFLSEPGRGPQTGKHMASTAADFGVIRRPARLSAPKKRLTRWPRAAPRPPGRGRALPSSAQAAARETCAHRVGNDRGRAIKGVLAGLHAAGCRDGRKRNPPHPSLAKGSARWRGTAPPPLGTRRARHRATPPSAPPKKKSEPPAACRHRNSLDLSVVCVRPALINPAPGWLSPQGFSCPSMAAHPLGRVSNRPSPFGCSPSIALLAPKPTLTRAANTV